MINTRAAIVIVTLACPGSAFAQEKQGDHWKHVPPLATACFSDDDFLGKLNAASTAIQAEIEKQDKINAAAKERFDNMDMMEKAQRMQTFMMKNPQAAMRMMQANEAAGAAASSAVSEEAETVQRLSAERERLEATFHAALAEAVKPVHGRRDALIEAKTVPVGEVQELAFTTAADHTQYVQLIEEENATIAKACVPFFGAGGSFHKWLASWRTEVIERNITAGATADIVVMQMEAMDLPGGGYRSTNPLQQVSNHVKAIGDVYGKRPSKVIPRIGLKR
jgi:hypothetical protein